MRSALCRALVTVGAVFALAGCTTKVISVVPVPALPPGSGAPPPRPAPPPATVPVVPPPPVPAPVIPSLPAPDPGGALVRVALATAAPRSVVGGTSSWIVLDRDGITLVASGRMGETWEIERDGRRIRATKPDGSRSVSVDGPLVARATGGGMLTIDGKRYRGEAYFYPGDSGITVVNRLRMEEYLAGVVPLEIGPRTNEEAAAVQAQAITARSYTLAHVAAPRTATYDVVSTVLDQVYGGADAESPGANAALAATRGLVLRYGGMVVSAPYHAVCGGSTAEPQEVWRSSAEPYLRRVSDRIPGSDRYYCDISPKFAWTRTYTPAELDAMVGRYLSQYVAVPAGGAGHVRGLSVASHTESGRVGTLTVSADAGNFVLRGNDIRFVLRTSGGEILNSTYFSVESTTGSNGILSRLTIRGMGNGHGIGMCQWGAIGRARAGQDVRAILAAYYPGTTIERAD